MWFFIIYFRSGLLNAFEWLCIYYNQKNSFAVCRKTIIQIVICVFNKNTFFKNTCVNKCTFYISKYNLLSIKTFNSSERKIKKKVKRQNW